MSKIRLLERVYILRAIENCMSKEHACDESIAKYMVISNEEQENMINTFRILRFLVCQDSVNNLWL